MPACHALTLAGHPCRGHGVHVKNELGSEGYLCHRHTSYFEISRPDQHLATLASPYKTDDTNKWLTRMLRSPLYRGEDRARTMSYLAPYTSPHAPQTSRKAYLGTLMYRHYVEAGILAPMAMLDFWKRNMQNGMHVIGYSCKIQQTPEGGVTVEFPWHFKSLVTSTYGYLVRGIPCSVVLRYFLVAMRSPFFSTNPPLYDDVPRRAKAVATIWLGVIDALLPLTSRRHLTGFPLEKVIKSIEEQHVGRPESTWWCAGVREHVTASLKGVQRCAREDERRRMELLKEELMAAAWKPERVLRWLEAGIEVEDM